MLPVLVGSERDRGEAETGEKPQGDEWVKLRFGYALAAGF